MELNKQDFENYLRSMDPGDTAGIRFHHSECPIARWTNRRVGPYGVIWLDKERREWEEMPAWIAIFVKEIDYRGNKGATPATASECLEVLAKIEED